jgi:phage gp29-like protein
VAKITRTKTIATPRKREGIRPPKRGAPPARYPVDVDPSDPQRPLAPVAVNERYPVVIGQGLTLSYIASTFRLCTTGYRQQYVDLLDELLEQDPHLFSVVQKRILSVANGRLEVYPAELEPEDPRTKRAKEIADFVRNDVRQIPDLSQALASLLWGGYYGVSCAEILWNLDTNGWHVAGLGFVHSRRLAYPDYQSWSLYIWDQGQVYGWDSPWGKTPTNSSIFGLKIGQYPGKFIVYAPQQRGSYPTRDGYGRQTATWALLKRIAGRGGSQYLERWVKPFMDIVYATQADGKPREATKEDIALAVGAAAAVGPGSMSGWAHPDSVKLDPKQGDAGKPKLTYKEWIDICNSEMSKAVLGTAIGTDHRGGGGLGGGGVAAAAERTEVDLEQYDATTLGETLSRDVAWWLVHQNFPGEEDLTPRIVVNVDKDPDAKGIAELAKTLTQIGCPVDADNLAEDVGIQLVPPEMNADGTQVPRRTFWSDLYDPSQVDPNLQSPEAKAQAQADKQAQADALKAKTDALAKGATQPPPKPGAGAPRAKNAAKPPKD